MSMEQALERSDWLRGLAEELVGDPALAGDLAADALRVLHARESVRNPRAFLRGVVRNLARRHRRSEQSRARREHSTARAEALPSTVELASQLEIQRILMAEVSALAPGARGVILLRFYHGLSCAEIARRQGLEPEAVRKRLERGLAALRARLDGKFDDRTTWAGLVGSLLDFDGARVAPAGSVSVFAGTLIMTTTKITAAAAILVAAAWFTVKGLGDGDSVSFPTQDGVAAAPSAEEADEPPFPLRQLAAPHTVHHRVGVAATISVRRVRRQTGVGERFDVLFDFVHNRLAFFDNLHLYVLARVAAASPPAHLEGRGENDVVLHVVNSVAQVSSTTGRDGPRLHLLVPEEAAEAITPVVTLEYVGSPFWTSGRYGLVVHPRLRGE